MRGKNLLFSMLALSLLLAVGWTFDAQTPALTPTYGVGKPQGVGKPLLAQRYQLRKRTPDFFSRSKTTNVRKG